MGFRCPLYQIEIPGSPLDFGRAYNMPLGTRLDMSTAFHPQTDGQSKRVIQVLEDLLRACVLEFGGNWEEHIALVKFMYNNSH